MEAVGNITEVQRPPLLRRIINFIYKAYNAYIYKPYLTLKTYYFNYRYVAMQEHSIKKICKDAAEFNDDEFKKYSFTMFQAVMQNLYYRYDSDEDCVKTLKLICNRGLNINQICPNPSGTLYYRNTELTRAISCGRDIRPEASLILLREFGANPFVADIYNKNALHFLLRKGHEVQRCIVDEVLNHEDIKNHIDDKTICGDTALHIACARRDEKSITQLLEKGASLEVKNKDGQTPIDVLHLSEQERLEFFPVVGCDIDKEIFNSDPQVIEAKIQEVKGVITKKKPKVLQDPILSNPIEQNRSK